jgi:hypothetical protein
MLKETVAKDTDPLEGFSTEGPVCPCCGSQRTPDEASYYDESGFELECDECGTAFTVQPFASWSWTSRPIVKEAKP